MKASKNKQPKIRRIWTRKPQEQIVPNRKKDNTSCYYCDGTGVNFYDIERYGTELEDCIECGGTGLK